MKIRIAVAQSENGTLRTCGPDDHNADHADAMDAAMTWLIEAGEITAARYWIEAEIPDPLGVVPTISGVVSKTEAAD